MIRRRHVFMSPGFSNCSAFHRASPKHAATSTSSPSPSPPSSPNTPHLLLRRPVHVAERIIALQFLLTRWGIESAFKRQPDDRIRRSYSVVQATMEETGVPAFLTSRETPLLVEKDLGSWNADELYNVGKQWESLGIILYTSRLIPSLPSPYPTTPFNHQTLFQSSSIVPAVPSTVLDFMAYFTTGAASQRSHFRHDEELKNAVDVTEAWVWRSQIENVLELKRKCDGDASGTYIRTLPASLRRIMSESHVALRHAAAAAHCKRLVPKVVDHDFGVDGTAYACLDAAAKMLLADIAAARLAALVWLMDVRRDWDCDKVKYFNPLNSIFNAS
ncbi:hypothetical protein SeMB42_g06897 [Synchytrium endobioticum]|uniref:Uncharacterized protein n=1 Tax=Synchytrium endobioticum TaxID=286115 RepID=A0A507C845_9FUNG|nr:hypothetical protein SeMB42_g06897 [Synchytrium endobioticum]TPX43649.1 hypothetical protein SeLEV6574_g04934 [Synchytrium endobioticum]